MLKEKSAADGNVQTAPAAAGIKDLTSPKAVGKGAAAAAAEEKEEVDDAGVVAEREEREARERALQRELAELEAERKKIPLSLAFAL